jgi:high-affinity Fe2+/Pb2+ permease
MVPASGVDVARETLLAAAVIDDSPPPRAVGSPARLLCGLLAALAVGVLVLWLVYSLAH